MAEPARGRLTLVVEFVGDRRELHPGDELTFGRRADLVVDDNRHLHRVLGRFSWSNDLWWLTNLGTAIPVNVVDADGPSSLRVAPGAAVPIPFAEAHVRFEAGGCAYELLLAHRGDIPLPDRSVHDELGELTTTASSLPLSDEQRLLLVALAEPRLRDVPGGDLLPTNRRIAHQLGWTITKFNRKLDGLCTKYAGAGVSGLRGSSDLLAKDRRQRLVEHVLHTGVITAADLPLLDAARR